MQIKAILLTPFVAAGLVNAAATPKQTIFQGLALRSASPVHFNYLQAANNSISLKLKEQGASCDRGVKTNQATFLLSDDELYLYKTDNPPQQLYVDRSGMGQGLFAYTTGVQGLPRNGERKGFKINKDGILQFDGSDFIACPNGKDLEKTSWTVWVNAGVENPGWGENCLGISVKAVKDKKPVGCQYTNLVAGQ
ncbi:cell wall [Fusarium beomiforme]|uniref:Cell wall n=1 Tax=Fusarium beomiforme TaxID=44412 RepID=A0A9P5A8L2_9HYPO|nr:cell wall [Fusarium beomiforme]